MRHLRDICGSQPLAGAWQAAPWVRSSDAVAGALIFFLLRRVLALPCYAWYTLWDIPVRHRA